MLLLIGKLIIMFSANFSFMAFFLSSQVVVGQRVRPQVHITQKLILIIIVIITSKLMMIEF